MVLPVSGRPSLVWQGIRGHVQALPLTLARHLVQKGTGATIWPISPKNSQSVEIAQQAGCLFTPPPGLAISRHKCGANRSVIAGSGVRLLTHPHHGQQQKKTPKLAHVKIWLTVRSCSQVSHRFTPPYPQGRRSPERTPCPRVALGPEIGGQLAERVPWTVGKGEVRAATTQPVREAGLGEVLAAPASVFVGCFCWRRFFREPAPTRRTK